MGSLRCLHLEQDGDAVVQLCPGFDQKQAPQLGPAWALHHLPSHCCTLGARSRTKTTEKSAKTSPCSAFEQLVRWLCTPGLRIWHLLSLARGCRPLRVPRAREVAGSGFVPNHGPARPPRVPRGDRAAVASDSWGCWWVFSFPRSGRVRNQSSSCKIAVTAEKGDDPKGWCWFQALPPCFAFRVIVFFGWPALLARGRLGSSCIALPGDKAERASRARHRLLGTSSTQSLATLGQPPN